MLFYGYISTNKWGELRTSVPASNPNKAWYPWFYLALRNLLLSIFYLVVKLDGAGRPFVVCDFSLLMPGIRCFMGNSAEQGNIILLISFGLHFNYILFPGPHRAYHTTLRPLVLFFLFFQMWLGNLTGGSLSENVIVFPLYLPRFYGGVKIKTFRKNRYPNLLSYSWTSLAFIFAQAFWLSDEKSLSLFPLHIQLFLHLGLLGPRVICPQDLDPILALCVLFGSAVPYSPLVPLSFISMPVFSSHLLIWQSII